MKLYEITSIAHSTFRVISSVKLKQLDRVVRKTIYVDPVFQDNDDSSSTKIWDIINTNSLFKS